MKKTLQFLSFFISSLICACATFGQDTIPPTPICHHGLSFGLRPGEPIVISARTFNLYSYDNLTRVDSLKYTYEDGSEFQTFVTNRDVELIPVYLYVEDLAGNKDYCVTYALLVTNGKAMTMGTTDTIPPVPVLITNINLVLEPSMEVYLNALYLNEASFDNLSLPQNLLYTFGPDPDTRYLVFNCFTTGYQELDVYVWDEEMNFTSVPVFFTVHESNLPCPDIIPDKDGPIAVLMDSLEVKIEENLYTPSIFPSKLNNGSYDVASGLFSILFKEPVYKYRFGCNDIGYHPIELILSDMNGNVTEAQAGIEVTDPNSYCKLSEKKIKSETLKLSPNPVSDQLIWHSEQANGHLILLDINGKTVLSAEKSSQKGSLSLGHLPAGIYILIDTNGLDQIGRKLVSKI